MVEGDRFKGGEGWEFQRVAETLRAEIADGIPEVGHFLPTQRKLVERFQVSRDTVQRALRVLIDEGAIESKQGVGSRVVNAQVEERQFVHSTSDPPGQRSFPMLGPFIKAAFEARDVTLDVATLTSESLDTHIRLQAERVRTGQIQPQSIEVRLLLPAEGVRLAYPRRIGDEHAEDLRPLDRLHKIIQRHTESLRAALQDLHTEGLVPEVDVQVRRVHFTPTFKLYLLNENEALHGLYVPVERAMRLDDGEEIQALDVLGLGAMLLHYVKDQHEGSPGSLFVNSAQLWFDEHWKMLDDTSAP